MIDTKHIGRQLPTTTFEVEKGRLRFFAKAIGETRPEYVAEAAGAVYLFCIPESDYVSGQVLVCGGGFSM